MTTRSNSDKFLELNGQLRSLNSINIPLSKFRLKILEILKLEGYITNFNVESSKQENIKVELKYFEGLQ